MATGTALWAVRRGHARAPRHPVMALGEELRLLRADPEGRLAQFAAALDAKAGHPVTGDWSPYVEDDIVGLLRGDDALVHSGRCRARPNGCRPHFLSFAKPDQGPVRLDAPEVPAVRRRGSRRRPS